MTWRAEMIRPFSLNNAFRNVSGRGRVKTKKYLEWRERCGQAIVAQGSRPAFIGPVSITIEIGEKDVSAQFDTDNAVKGYLDVLVGLGVIPDDNRKIVKRIAVEWRDGEGADVTISDYEGREK